MAAFLIGLGLIAIVDGIVTITTLGLVVLALSLGAIAYAQITGYIALANSITGQTPLLDSISLQLSAQQVAQLNTQYLPQRQMPDHSFPSHRLPSRQAPDHSLPNRGSQQGKPPPPPPPNCPPGFTWNPATQQCEANPPPPPNCPPGTTWDPQLQTCVPDVVTPQCPEGFAWNPATEQCEAIKPPPPPPICPPGTTWNPQTMTCEPNPPQPPPTQPIDDPTQDEIEKCCSQATYNAQLIQSELASILAKLASLQVGQSEPGNPDPVTCTQLTGAVGAIVQQLSLMTAAIATLTPGAPTTVDLSAIVAALDNIANTIAGKPAPAVDLAPLVAAIVDRNPAVDAYLRGVVDRLNQAGVLDPQLAQLLEPPPPIP